MKFSEIKVGGGGMGDGGEIHSSTHKYHGTELVNSLKPESVRNLFFLGLDTRCLSYIESAMRKEEFIKKIVIEV